MALYTARTICLCPLRTFSIRTLLCSTVHLNKDIDNGALDEFTSQLVQSKITKWERRKYLAQQNTCRTVPINDVSKPQKVDSFDVDEINDNLMKAVDYVDMNSVVELIELCLKHQQLPSLPTLTQVLSLLSRSGKKTVIIRLAELCGKLKPDYLKDNSSFEHYIAEAIWVNGDIRTSLNLFERIYRRNAYARRRLKSIIKHLISESVANHSEATMVNIMHFCDMLVVEFNDYFLMACLWQNCMVSEWFTDQQIALDLLKKYPGLPQKIINKIPYVVRISLRINRTEPVYRLTEILLKLEMDSELSQVLLALIDYWIQQGDLKQCREIVLWTLDNGIDVPTVIRNEKLIKLLLRDQQVEVKHDIKPKPSDYKF